MRRGARQQGRGGGGQRGVASVEFAVGSLVIILLMLVSAELGRVLYSYNTLTKTVRTGSRYLSGVAMSPASVVDLSEAKLTRTRNLVVSGDIDGGGAPLLEGLTADAVEIRAEESEESTGRYVRVSAAFDYRPMLGVISGFGFGEGHDFGITMSATSAMQVLR